MKKLYFLVIALCFFATTKAQIVTITDANFKTKLLAASSSNTIAKDLAGIYFKIDANSDGEIQDSEAMLVSYLNVTSSSISDLTGILSFPNLKYLYCNINQLTNLNLNSLKNLNYLDCSLNLLPSLDVSSLTNLNYLKCNNNLLPSLDVNGLTNLNYLYCNYNLLPSLDVSGLTNLNYLDCGHNLLTSLNVSSLTNLIRLDCGNNLLLSLDVSGLTKLLFLNCFTNSISTLNVSGLTNLQNLNCVGNLLSVLNVNGLTNLQSLVCSGNLLSSLNVTGLTNLQGLLCPQNKLSSLDVSGLTKLQTLNCFQNELSSLDVNGLIKLQTLDCSSNQLTSLFIKNGFQKINLNFSNNPNLKFICADEIRLTQVQNLIDQYGYTNCSVNSYCSFVPGGIFYTIQGNQKFDSNTNGCDALDGVVPNLKFAISDGVTTGSLISNATGNYSIPVPAGTYTITPKLENPAYFNVSPTNVNVTFPTQTSPVTQNFCISVNGIHPDFEVALLPLQPARPGFDAIYKIVYKNKGTTTQTGSVNLTFNDAVLDLVVANPVITTLTTNNLSWDFSNLLPFETREIAITLNVNSPMETPAVNGGSILVYKTTIASAATDETPLDNTFVLNQTVVNSYDPNDKTCLEGTTISPSLIGQYVHYMIRFENTGTFPAQNIVVKDMIDLSKFDISTLVPTNASDSYITKISASNKVEFIFENINLPFDDANNDGYIAFKIKTLPTLVVGNTFTNDASIFFDYNFPIVTNKATSTFKTLGIQDFEFSNYFTLYPNPAKEVLNISSKETIEVQSISIYNTLGQLVLVIPNAEKVSKIDVSNLTNGNYFIKINSDKGTSNTRFIKE